MPNILIVDDDRYTTRLLSDLLAAKHAGVAVAHDGAEARHEAGSGIAAFEQALE